MGGRITTYNTVERANCAVWKVNQVEIVHRDVYTPFGPWPRLLPNGGCPEDRDAFYVSFDPVTEDPIAVVVNAVATILNVETYELEPFQYTVDADAVEALVTSRSKDAGGDLEVSFVYQGFEISVTSGGDVWIEWQ